MAPVTGRPIIFDSRSRTTSISAIAQARYVRAVRRCGLRCLCRRPPCVQHQRVVAPLQVRDVRSDTGAMSALTICPAAAAAPSDPSPPSTGRSSRLIGTPPGASCRWCWRGRSHGSRFAQPRLLWPCRPASPMSRRVRATAVPGGFSGAFNVERRTGQRPADDDLGPAGRCRPERRQASTDPRRGELAALVSLGIPNGASPQPDEPC